MIVSLRPHFVVAIVCFLPKGLTNLLVGWFVECLRRESLGGGQRPQHVYQKQANPQESQPVTDLLPILCAAHVRSDLEPIRLARTH